MRLINGLLVRFVGHKINPVDVLFVELRKVVLQYFIDNPEDLKYFTTNNDPFDYTFEVEEQAGHVTNIEFQA